MDIEFEILDFIHQLHTPVGDTIFRVITKMGDFGAVWIVLTLIIIIYPKSRNVGLILAISLVLDFLFCNVIIKPLVARIRPYELNTVIELLIEKQKDYSFPSGHTAAAFAFVTPFFVLNIKKYGVCFMVPAILISFSRLYFYVHYPTDIIGGIIVGVVCGVLSCYFCKRFLHITGENLVITDFSE